MTSAGSVGPGLTPSTPGNPLPPRGGRTCPGPLRPLMHPGARKAARPPAEQPEQRRGGGGQDPARRALTDGPRPAPTEPGRPPLPPRLGGPSGPRSRPDPGLLSARGGVYGHGHRGSAGSPAPDRLRRPPGAPPRAGLPLPAPRVAARYLQRLRPAPPGSSGDRGGGGTTPGRGGGGGAASLKGPHPRHRRGGRRRPPRPAPALPGTAAPSSPRGPSPTPRAASPPPPAGLGRARLGAWSWVIRPGSPGCDPGVLPPQPYLGRQLLPKCTHRPAQSLQPPAMLGRGCQPGVPSTVWVRDWDPRSWCSPSSARSRGWPRCKAPAFALVLRGQRYGPSRAPRALPAAAQAMGKR